MTREQNGRNLPLEETQFPSPEMAQWAFSNMDMVRSILGRPNAREEVHAAWARAQADGTAFPAAPTNRTERRHQARQQAR